MTASSSSSSHFVASSPMSPSLNADLFSSYSASSATLSASSVLSSEPVSVSFENSPFIDRLGRFKRGTYRIMLIETGMSYDIAKTMADKAAEQYKLTKSMPLANSAASENSVLNANIEVRASVSDFDEIEYFDQMVTSGVDPALAADIARKTAEAKRRDPLERTTRYKPRHRIPDPVHRDSYEVGERENSVWKPVNPNEIGAYLEAVDQYSIKTKGLSDKAVRLLKMLFRMVDFKTGRLEPTLDTICDSVGYARATVVKLLRQLQDLGFIRWIRRSIKIKADGRGPRRKQTSNAYGFLSPKAWPELARQVFERVMRRRNAPVPDDIDHAQEADKAETKAIIESLPPEDFVREISGAKAPNALTASLIQLAKSIEREEQREQAELAKKATQVDQDGVKASSKISKEDTPKTPQIPAKQREFNSYTLSYYSYFNNNDAKKFETTEGNKDYLAPANAGSTGVVLDTKPEPNRFTKELNTLNLRPDQVAAVLQHRNKRREQRMMPLSPKDIADLLIKTRQMHP